MSIKQFDYDAFASYYDVMDGTLIEYDKAAKMISDTLKLEKAKILDMACGTGNFTIALHKLGHDVEGMDISEGMLREARKKADDLRFSKHDMRKPLRGRYDLITCMFNSVAHITPKELETVLTNLHDHTRYLVFDIFNFEFMDKNFRAYPFIDLVYNSPKLKIVRFNNNTLDREKHIMHITQETWFQEPNKPAELVKGSWDMQIYTRQEIEDLLAKTGYELREVFGRFDKEKGMSPYTKESISMIFFSQST